MSVSGPENALKENSTNFIDFIWNELPARMRAAERQPAQTTAPPFDGVIWRLRLTASRRAV
ncbi:hypothetical protein BQ8482_160042 [Mesorhizobium delmotii]|uniref:Uncharacterized protein n=1 Tax=Mesorhizobium delmotii TaxID=1631247 RepID=A0A2P9AHI3_9HYPH|nr:hypothetical protein BQ8482_160042 [Mesorhizobium delmotii]